MTTAHDSLYSLSPERVEAFHRDGFMIIDDLFDASQTRDIQQWTAEVKAWPNIPGRHMPYEEERADGTTGLCRTENYANYHDGFGKLFHSKRLTDILSELMGEQAVLFKEKINYKEAGGSGGFDAHIDATAYNHAGAVNHLTFLMAVNDMNMENGCLEVVAGSHKEQIPLGNDKCIDKAWEERQTWIPVPCKAGTLLVFGSYLAHRSGPNSSPRPRAAIYATYNGISEGDKHDSYYVHRRKAWPPTFERDPNADYTEGAITYAFGSPMTGGKTAIDARNAKKVKAEETVDRLFELIKAQGDAGYIGENISQLEHSLQAADQARQSGADSETVLAALLHDIGQFLPDDQAKDMMHDGISVGRKSHDAMGEVYLRQLGFPEKVCQLVGAHVVAKRYLTAKSPAYLDSLSSASKLSLKYQGGPFTSAEVAEFEKDPFHQDKVRLRRWDDLAKREDYHAPGLETYRDLAVSLLV